MFQRFQLIKKVFSRSKILEYSSVCSRLKIMDGIKAMKDLGYMFNGGIFYMFNKEPQAVQSKLGVLELIIIVFFI